MFYHYICMMKIGFWKNTITLFFLSAFLFLRIANFHSFSHLNEDEEDVQHCELCDLITQSNSNTLDFCPDSPSIPEQNISNVFNLNEFGYYTSPAIKVLYFENFYNKPPPGIIV